LATILIGWELGGGTGHAISISHIVARLRESGHEPVVAAQNIALFDGLDVQIWQAPLPPRLLASSPGRQLPSPNSMGDILARLGCDDAATVALLVKAWDRILESVDPALVIGDFAPFLLAAARERWPSVSVGNGFIVPPSEARSFPSLTGLGPVHDEADTLAKTNEGLRLAGREPLGSFPAMFAATRELLATFAEIDPYRQWRSTPCNPPIFPFQEEAEAGSGDEIFFYAPEGISSEAAIWEGLAQSGLPVRVHMRNPSAALVDKWREAGFAVQLERLSLREIAERSRLLMSHGGHGSLCAAFLLGLPQVVCHYDLEKRLYGNAVAALGLGGHVGLHAVQPSPFAASLVHMYQDDSLAARARAAAPAFRSRMTGANAGFVAEAVDALLSS
jgi:UDP:flavonoid glycosyltransferase YjiC (YdhE family)